MAVVRISKKKHTHTRASFSRSVYVVSSTRTRRTPLIANNCTFRSFLVEFPMPCPNAIDPGPELAERTSRVHLLIIPELTASCRCVLRDRETYAVRNAREEKKCHHFRKCRLNFRQLCGFISKRVHFDSRCLSFDEIALKVANAFTGRVQCLEARVRML